MFPFFSSMRPQRSNQAAVNRALEKYNRRELTVEDILDEDDLVLELKSYSYSQLMNL
jgi:hypothetical protein